MPRDIPVGNGSLLVNFDQQYHLRDVYWPYVGEENHTAGHPSRFGVWVDGTFSWVHDEGWSRSINYEPETLVSQVTLYNPSPQVDLRIICRDTVDFHEDLFLRRIEVHNFKEDAREARLFFSQDFHIYGNDVGDSAYYEPERVAVYHYKGQRWFMINVAKPDDKGWKLGVDQWAVGVKETQGKEGTWRDAEDGTLSGNAVAQGSVDSTVALHLTVPGRGETVGWYYIAAADHFKAVTTINRKVRRRGPDTFLERTRHYWKLWIQKEEERFPRLPASICTLYRRSLLIIRTQIDNGGAIMAANDFDITHYGRDTYAYMWPRDGALVAATLVDAGYSQVTRKFFDFCHRVITDEGYLLHKYAPDGALASSWHGWYLDGRKVLPVQEDETALVIWALWRHFEHFRDVEFVKPHFRGLVVRSADWMTGYRSKETGLPRPSWDLWEERRGIHAWTVGAVWGGLEAAARFSVEFGEQELAEEYRRAADEVKAAVEEHLWSDELGRFVRSLYPDGDGWQVDRTVDSSISGLWLFGMFSADDPRIVDTMDAMRDRLWVKTDVGGMARYENDDYHRVSDGSEGVPGNPWFISTLWFAQWLIAKARTLAELEPALDILNWASSHALPSGVMAEQFNPYTNEPISVSPLTWSHATYAATVRKYVDRRNRIESGLETEE